MVDQSPDHGLIVGSYMPDDVSDDGTVSTSCIAFFAYPGDEEARAYSGSLEVASYMALMEPPVALALAAWLDDLALWGKQSPHAVAVARAVLREEGEQR
jgi:hypothetical protein